MKRLPHALQQTLLYGASIALMKGISLLMLPFIAHHLAPQAFGQIDGREDGEQAGHDQGEAARQSLIIHHACALQLWQEISGALDWPGHKLRKEGHERHIVDQIRRRPKLASVNINRIA